MARVFPEQTRTIDPYSELHTNSVNKITEFWTRGNNYLLNVKDMRIAYTADGTNDAKITVGDGFAVVDNVIINFTSDTVIDPLNDPGLYTANTIPDSTGRMYVCADYTYVKTRPPNEAKIIILRPAQHILANNNSNYLFLGCFDFVPDGTADIRISDVSVAGIDVDNPTVGVRRYVPHYAGAKKGDLPTYDVIEHEGQLVYLEDNNILYYGAEHDWRPLNIVAESADTTLCSGIQLGYMGSDEKVRPAIATSVATYADCIVTSVGTKEENTGIINLLGPVQQVPVDTTSAAVVAGNSLYLSPNEAGTVTSSLPFNQQITGTATTSEYLVESVRVVDIWFIAPITVSFGGIGSDINNIVTYAGADDTNDTTPDYTAAGALFTQHVVDNDDLTVSAANLDNGLGWVKNYAGDFTDGAGNPLLPEYSSTNYVTNNDPLVDAISTLDTAVKNTENEISPPVEYQMKSLALAKDDVADNAYTKRNTKPVGGSNLEVASNGKYLFAIENNTSTTTKVFKLDVFSGDVLASDTINIGDVSDLQCSDEYITFRGATDNIYRITIDEIGQNNSHEVITTKYLN